MLNPRTAILGLSPTGRPEGAEPTSTPRPHATLRAIPPSRQWVRVMSVSDWKDHGHHVYQASGMVSVQAACTVYDALTLMKERALVSHRTLEEVAVAVIERRIRFAE